MDDKTFVASFVAKEMQRINESLKEMVTHPEAPTEEKKNAVLQDIETTLARLKSALMHLSMEMDEEDADIEDRQDA